MAFFKSTVHFVTWQVTYSIYSFYQIIGNNFIPDFHINRKSVDNIGPIQTIWDVRKVFKFTFEYRPVLDKWVASCDFWKMEFGFVFTHEVISTVLTLGNDSRIYFMQKKYICILKSLFKIKSFKFEFQSQQTNWKINLNLPDKTDCWRPTEILRPFQGLKKKNYQKFSWKGKPFELINEKNKETRKFLSFRNNLSWNFIRRQVFPIRFPKSIPWKFKSRKVVSPKRKIISKNKFFFYVLIDPIQLNLHCLSRFWFCHHVAGIMSIPIITFDTLCFVSR